MKSDIIINYLPSGICQQQRSVAKAAPEAGCLVYCQQKRYQSWSVVILYGVGKCHLVLKHCKIRDCFIRIKKYANQKYPDNNEDLSGNRTHIEGISLEIKPMLKEYLLKKTHTEGKFLKNHPSVAQHTHYFIKWKSLPTSGPLNMGEGGYLDLLWFPITQICVRIQSTSMPEFVYAIFPVVFCRWLSNSQIWWTWTRPWTD